MSKQKRIQEYKPSIDWSDEFPCEECGAVLPEHEPHWQILVIGALGEQESFDIICESCFAMLNDLILDKLDDGMRTNSKKDNITTAQ